jgi:cyclopropane fatty-acyl-phospholipid synthase-like methyltransferase
VLEALVSAGILADKTISPSALVDSRLGEVHADIKSMHLYNRPELLSALYRRLANAGLSSGPLKYTDLLPFDQHHYFGVAALDAMQEVLCLAPGSRVLNIGSGLGGPARYLAGKYGCQVLAIELQDDLHHAARDLTTRCGLGDKVHHVAGDFLQIAQHLQKGGFDCVVSWLTILHFSDRVGVFRLASELLHPGGHFFAADFVQRNKLTEAEWKTLHVEVACPSLAPSIGVYCYELESAGFKVTRCQDESESWTSYTQQRVAAMQSGSDKAVLGDDVYEGLLHFYSVVRDLFAGGNLGGLSIYSTKPLW